MTRPTLIDLNPDKYNQELRCYPFVVKLDRCKRSFNFDDPFSKICVSNKTKVNSNIFNMIARINESKTSTKIYHAHVNLDDKKCISNQKWNNNKCQCECKNRA